MGRPVVDLETPIVVMSFNRPNLLGAVLDSLRAQAEVSLSDRRVFLFQDGAVNRYSKVRYAPDRVIDECIGVFLQRFPKGQVMASPDNIGICENFLRAEHYVFEVMNADCAFFFEDDLQLGRHYLESLEKIRAWADETRDVAYFSCYGDYYSSADWRLEHEREFSPMDHLWGFGLFKRKWQSLRSFLQPYYDVTLGSDYNRRDHQAIFALYEHADIAPSASSQDAAKSIACARAGLTRINTVRAFGKYIGNTGVHMTAHAYEEIGFGRINCSQEPLLSPRFPDDALRASFRLTYLAQRAGFRTSGYGEMVADLPPRRLSPARICGTQDVVEAYRVLLNRSPEGQHIIDQYSGRQSVFRFIQGIVKSKEFSSLGEIHAGIEANEENVSSMYRLLLHREPDTVGLQRRLAHGYDVRQVALSIISADEFLQLTAACS